ncbi:Uncharacterised protein [uncultured archaeon]|nr:Uncharacterised protein [uncultured archaeon]
MKLFWVLLVVSCLASSALVSDFLEQTPSSVRNVFTVQNDDFGGHFELRIFGDTNSAKITSSENYFYVAANSKYSGYYLISSPESAKIYVQILKNDKVISFRSYSFEQTDNLKIKDVVSVQGANYKIDFTVSNTGSKPGVINFMDSDHIVLPGETRTFSKIYLPREIDPQGYYSIIVDGTLLKKQIPGPSSTTSGFFLAGDSSTIFYAVIVLVLIIFVIIFFSVKPKKPLEENEIEEKLQGQEILPEFNQNVV